ncbi:tRNA sulfurtransferase [Candidatus Photodesmus blepharus]|uniref:tRNA sulfurtransferase n=1 Tax=Candidatus Photodesmus blepharonis TaxID=1179155 RepID=A0A084CPI2_9GAMM|nr:tRNA sulfurtransferase [Candidatus Photodesmus blepharus]
MKRRTKFVEVFNRRDHIEVNLQSQKYSDEILKALTHIPGIHYILEVQQSNFIDVNDICKQVLDLHCANIERKTFVVRVKRRGKHNFTSTELECQIGGVLNQAVNSACVKLVNPDVTINIEVINKQLNQVLSCHKGLGGFPLGTQEDVLSLISGGFDSAVSSYLHIKRGSKTHYCFFNLGGSTHEIGVKQVSYFLWKKYGSSAKVKFLEINFESVVAEILEKIEDSQMGVVLKRMFIRAGTMLAKKYNIQALVTGEALGQVSSQTLTNLRCINSVTDILVLRPLINWDKEDIIRVARDIGTEIFSRFIPEYCGVISKKPTVKAVIKKLEDEERKFDFSLLEHAVNNSHVVDIRDIKKESFGVVSKIEQVKTVEKHSIILDIRSPDEKDNTPLKIDGAKVQHLPFFRLSTQFGSLDQNKTYLLYCAHGIMSRIQALHLQEDGFDNVKIYRP